MVGFFPSRRAAAAQARNPVDLYDRFMNVAEAPQITAAGSTNTIGTYVSLGTTTAALRALLFQFGGISTASVRYLAHVKINGVVVTGNGIYIQQTTTAYPTYELPLQVPSGATVEVAIQASSAGASLRCWVKGIKANAFDAPGFANCESPTVVFSGATQASSVDLPNTDTWTEVIASTAHHYGAILPFLGTSGAIAGGQRGELYFGLWNGSSYDIIWSAMCNFQGTSPYVYGVAGTPAVEIDIPFASKIGAKLTAGTGTNADLVRPGLMGFY